ncbi:MAG: META domain-containing protein [Oceanococcus sp.]
MKTKQQSRSAVKRTALLGVLSSALLASCALCQGGKQTMPVLEDVQWVVNEMDGRAILPDSLVTMNFSNDGRVSGKASCNGYSGLVERDESTITVSKIIQTKRLCRPASLMEQEQKFSALLQQTMSWVINEQGQLQMTTQSGASLTASVQEQ